MKEKIKNIINSVPNYCWYFFVLIAVILIMDIKNGPLEIQKYLIIEDIQQASYDSQTAAGIRCDPPHPDPIPPSAPALSPIRSISSGPFMTFISPCVSSFTIIIP